MLEEQITLLGDRLAENDVPGVQRALGDLRTTFHQHLALENDKLYPALLEKAQGTQVMLTRSFADGMDVITNAMLRFVDRYEKQASFNPDSFAQDWNPILHALRSRLQAEEVSLFPMFQKLQR